MEKEIIKSYLLASHHLQERANYDLSHKPELVITSIKKQGTEYQVKGNLYVNLGVSCPENNVFNIRIKVTPEEVSMETEVKAINSFMSRISGAEKQISVESEPTMHTDVFRVNFINGSKYLIQIIDETITKVYVTEDDYQLRNGIPQNLIEQKLPKEQHSKKRSRIKRIMNNISNRH